MQTYYPDRSARGPGWEGTLRFFVAWVLPTGDSRRIYPHLFSKTIPGVAIAQHFIRSRSENWMGRADVRWVRDEHGDEILATFEETTNLPLEIQAALDALTQRSARPRATPARRASAAPCALITASSRTRTSRRRGGARGSELLI